MKKKSKTLLSSNLSELVERFSQANIIAEIEKRYQSAPAKLLPISSIDDTSFIQKVVLPEKTIEDFARRLKEKGFYNPLVVRTKEDGRYEIILGRKRLFGAKKAGMLSLPCAFAEVEDEEMLLMLLADTRDQREANVIELALVCRELQTRFHYTQETLAELSHQSRCQISNILRILRLPDELQRDICLGNLSYGHGRALASLPPEEALALGREVKEKALSVRQIEDLVHQKTLRMELANGKAYRYKKRGSTLTLKFNDAAELEAFIKEKLS